MKRFAFGRLSLGLAVLVAASFGVPRRATAQTLSERRAVGAAQDPKAGAAAPGAMDAREADHYYRLFGEIVSRCPVGDQEAVFDALDALGRRYGRRPDPGAPTPDDDARLAAQTRAMYEKMRALFPPVEVTIGAGGAETAGRAPINLARGLGRFVLIEFRNGTDAPVTLDTPSTPPRRRGDAVLTIPPGAMRPLFLEISIDRADTEALTREWTAAGRAVRVTIPVKVSEPATLKGTLIDSDTGAVLPGRVHIKGSDGVYHRARLVPPDDPTLSEKMIPRQFARNLNYQWTFFYSDGHFEIRLPPGETALTLERGFEHEITTQTLTLKPGEIREAKLASGRFIDMQKLGWISGDTHVHWVKNPWNVDEDINLLPIVQRAEDLRVANNLILRHHRPPAAEFQTPTYLPVGPAPSMCGPDYHIQMAEEYRNEPFYGHLIFLNIKKLVQPVSTGAGIMGPGAIDYPINRTAILNARSQGGIVIEAHGLTGDGPANIIDHVTDSLDQIQPDDYYTVLNAGFRLPLTNGSDHPMRAIGFVRAYVKIDGDGPFTYQKWIDGIRARRTFTTAGPLLFLTVNGKDMGEEVRAGRGEPLRVKARVASRLPIGHFQLVRDGEVIKDVATRAREAEIEWEGPAGQSGWFAVRSSDKPFWEKDVAYMVHYGGNVAHSSAVYVVVDGKPIFKPEAAVALAGMLRKHSAMVAEKGVYENDAQRQEALKIYTEAAGAYDQLVALYGGGGK
ncbi:MAG: CehA/McbA family metallohydrolase [bacterium]|nr:CehA/McbA family metallohydrolase [bacterium]